jgi:ribosome assembly protein YihI (activator of Der GTPase)
MTRQKKTRKAAPLGPTQKARIKKAEEPTVGKRIKKHKGQVAGSRNNPETRDSSNQKNAGKSNDPRHGSKTPISLTPVELVKKPNFIPQVKLKKVEEPAMPPEQELEAIENDERLQALLDRVDNDEVLTGKDAKYFNAKTARHQALMEELGFEDDEDFDEEESLEDSRSLVEQWEDEDKQ